MRRVICIGNSLIAEDSAGPQMYSALRGLPLPADVELIDGGTRGLDLLPFFDGAEQVVLIDQVVGFVAESAVVVLEGDDLLKATERRLDHQTGIGFLVRLLPQVCEVAVPDLKMIGIEGCLNPKKRQACQTILINLLSR